MPDGAVSRNNQSVRTTERMHNIFKSYLYLVLWKHTEWVSVVFSTGVVRGVQIFYYLYKSYEVGCRLLSVEIICYL